ncbi:DUF2180 family protein [Lentzea alba]|uniref:DUF2180 family protein n=1 Tax=Lentzea TaxID=165301 RepID=UPI001300897A|nr:DUF2180 family protein [Lentzea terrae]
MNCYDCAIENQTTTATAVCRHCGAAVCAEHAHVIAEAFRHFSGMGPADRLPLARRISCGTCYHAEHGTQESVDGTAAPREHVARGQR